MFKKNHYTIISLLLGSILLVCCQKPDDYKKYTDAGEKIYPGAVVGAQSFPGNGRVLLAWTHGIDSRVKKYKITWNNGAGSKEVDAKSLNTGDTLKLYIDQLAESSYNFIIYSLDDAGNQSVSTILPPVKAYGSLYKNSLYNRGLDISNATLLNSDGSVTVNFIAADTINIETVVRYTDNTNTIRTTTVSADSFSTNLPNYKLGSYIYLRSSYKPVSIAIDTFITNAEDSVMVKNVPVNKAGWAKINLPNDITGDAYGTNLSKIWDGSPGGYPNIFHSGWWDHMPQHFTIDLGGLYNLTQFAEWGRQDCGCHNPDKFEVWGIADITGAATTLPSDDAGWKNESIAKGWTLLANITRTDNGTEGLKWNLNNPSGQKFRYIRIRILHTIDNHSSESHMSEISFWYNP